MMLGILPLAYLGCGVVVVLHTRRKQNEQV